MWGRDYNSGLKGQNPYTQVKDFASQSCPPQVHSTRMPDKVSQPEVEINSFYRVWNWQQFAQMHSDWAFWNFHAICIRASLFVDNLTEMLLNWLHFVKLFRCHSTSVLWSDREEGVFCHMTGWWQNKTCFLDASFGGGNATKFLVSSAMEWFSFCFPFKRLLCLLHLSSHCIYSLMLLSIIEET